MAYVLTEIALQLKGTLAFVLGLGGMFTIAKGLLISFFILPKITSSRSSVKADAAFLRRWLIACALASLALFLFALWLYFGSALTSIDVDALKRGGGLLTVRQQWATAGVALVAIALVLIECIASVLKYRFDLLSKIS